MITPELIGYIRTEFAKGRTREEVHADLAKNGGWGEADINEAFRTVIPMQSFTRDSVIVNKETSSWLGKIILIVIIGAICFALWFYRGFYSAPLMTLWNSLPFVGVETPAETNTAPQNSLVAPPAIIGVKDCGISTTTDLKNPLIYENDAVLACLGASALRCEDAKAILNDALFPNVFQITKNQGICNFRLSYGQESTLVDVTGKKLAGQYISCPLSIVKAIDETKTAPTFNAPSTNNPNRYASQIYFYGILGIFMENNVDQNKIQALGCNGDYISSVVASYRKMQSKQ